MVEKSFEEMWKDAIYYYYFLHSMFCNVPCNAISFAPMWCDVMRCKNTIVIYLLLFFQDNFIIFCAQKVGCRLFSIDSWMISLMKFFVIIGLRARCFVFREHCNLIISRRDCVFIYLFCCNKNTIFIYLSKKKFLLTSLFIFAFVYLNIHRCIHSQCWIAVNVKNDDD